MTRRMRVRYSVDGVVQGVGYRPFVYVTAVRLGLTGFVMNDVGGVVVEVEGTAGAVEDLGRSLRFDAPPLASVVTVTGREVDLVGGTGFAIADTEHATAVGRRALPGPDVATCADCLRELADPSDRRYRHPFISCTNCGPRFSIIRSLPYDRPATTMADFPMCPACAAEYADPADRRFHAQTIACHDCGPDLELIGPGIEHAEGEAALTSARGLLASGGILAVKGLGGYHLACNARDASAVDELRRRKRRGDKPFAVMVRDLEVACSLVGMSSLEAELLTSSRRPIVLIVNPAGRGGLADGVAPRSGDLGLLLPYTPIHTLLLDRGVGETPDILVMSSGNLGGEPITYDDDDAVVRLAPIVDGWLRHDRPIQVPTDDSVTRIVDEREAPVRRSRGYAPLPVALPVPIPASLAVGADLKNTCGVGEGSYAWLSQHIGDMDDLATIDAFTASQSHLRALVSVDPDRLVADKHPGYRSSGWARRHAAGRPVHLVQHHHAHVAAVMAEHGLDGRDPVIGFAFDGTGFGTDGAVWGGEVLVADYKGFQRAAHLKYVSLPGGDAAVERPYRMALAHLFAAGVPWDTDLKPLSACGVDELRVLDHQLRSGFGCVPTSSMGRLFDAVSSIAGVRHVADYEAEAAIELEAKARGVAVDGMGYAFAVSADESGGWVGDAAPVIREVVRDTRDGVPVSQVAARFHDAVLGLIAELADRVRLSTGLDTAVLGGGVFGNAILLSGARRRLQASGFDVLTPEQLPANDGGIALGQLMIGAHA